MKLMHSEWEGRLDHWINTLKKDFYTPLGELNFKAYVTDRLITPDMAKKLADTPVKEGFTWGRSREYCWFYTEMTVPANAEGKMIVLNLEPGGESTLFVNGRSFGTYRAGWVDVNYQFYSDNILTTCAKPGENFEILMETYAGHFYPESELGGCATGPVLPGTYMPPDNEGKRSVLGKCTYGIWNEECYQLYMDVMTLRSLLKVLDSTSLRAAKIAKALERFTLTVDFEQESDKRNADYIRAREELKEVLEKVNGSTAPRFFAVGHAHLDYVWLWPIEETIRKTSRTFAAQLRLMDMYPDYKFIQSMPAEYELVKEHYPELFERIKEKAKEGRWIADGAMWVEPDTNMTGGEAMIRQILYGKKYYREEFGVNSEVLWLPDTFGYSAVLPQILKKTGVKYLITQKIFWSYNEGEEFPYHYFTWRGMDGSDIVTFLNTSYTYNTAPADMVGTWQRRRQAADIEGFLIPFGYGDGGGGPARDHVEYVLRQKDLEGSVKMEFAEPKVFFEEMEKLGGPKERYDGELYFTAHRGTYTTQANIKKYNRKNEILLRELEIWSALAAFSGAMANACEDEAESLWKELLTCQFHDILPGSSIKEVYEYVEEKQQRLAERAKELISEAQEAMAADTGDYLTVFNSLGFERKVVVDLPDIFEKGAKTDDGKSIAVSKEEGKVRALVKLPSLGAVALSPCECEKDFAPAKATKKDEGIVLENEKIRAVINERGEIISYKIAGSPIEFAAEPMNRLRIFKSTPRLFDAWDVDSVYREEELEGAKDVSVIVLNEEGLVASVKVKGTIGMSSFEQVISLRTGADRIEIAMDIDWKELHRFLKVAFPVNVRATDGINEIQFGYVKRPTHRSRLYDKERFEVCNHRYSALCDGSHGVAILNDCKYGISMNDNSLELSLLTAAASPQMRADNKKHSFCYAITAFTGTFEESKVVREGYDLNIPPQVIRGRVPSFTGFKADNDAIVLEAIKAADDRSGDLILRLYEAKNSSVNVKICMDVLKGKKAFLCDMLENKESEIKVEDNSITLDFSPFEIKTVRIVK